MSVLPDPLCRLPLGGGFDGYYVSHRNAIRRGPWLKLRRASHLDLHSGSETAPRPPQTTALQLRRGFHDSPGAKGQPPLRAAIGLTGSSLPGSTRQSIN